MRVFITILLAVLLCLDQGSEQKETKSVDESRDDDYDYKDDDDDDDDDDDEVEIKHIPYEGSLECYTCESESIEDRCNKIKTCAPSQTFCKTIITRGNAESNFFTTFSAWCSDTCKEATKIIEGTHVTVNCCQHDMCNPLSVVEGRASDTNSNVANCGCILTGVGVTTLFMLLCSWLGRDL
ncbi:glycosylphosphatidylinositol-anchored high density lipoprotein-binding protein 1 [Dromiciops gliroides]|uniref:glycosylphosphatidylinositol-anchored high density lipoprotein-binding protein 1 n=1 Tax=Dromiciops gliroides TaxID=33562 RepID=UPI001CC4B2D0|nr:glycosylphosphatidylinositol-anchored high density lipoprotein-binding protein 1 [Dromiciops gliroides]XP_043833804.1 glycosylphosphatidylinositol-anchored high density lipoprotein-binding protein 1 [Dromiciops gliroides]XP_043833805.1 glycosylphosphatidylinositol-anchored high density lipoprotein-binding protein 1 [Dromiciops gliroides]